MKQVSVREFFDLTEDEKQRIRLEQVEKEVDFQLEILGQQLQDEVITEKEYYSELGCDKYYAETTSWFIPSCYYEKHKKDVDEYVEKFLEESLFGKFGQVVYL